MRNHTIEFNGQEIEFRLTSEDMLKLEEKNHVKILDYIQDYSLTTILNLLWYMRKGVQKDFSREDTNRFFDELADNDWALEDIMKNIIYPTCQVSGLLTKSDLNKILDKLDNMEAPQESQNQ